MSTITQKFVDAFDSSNKKHVEWLRKFFSFTKNIAETRGNIKDFLDDNPFKIKLSDQEYLEWVHIHFVVSMKYARDVLEKNAWIPN